MKKERLNVVVTGGTRGLGRELVAEFIKEKDNVVVLGRNIEGVRGGGDYGNVCGIFCDVRKRESIKLAVEKVVAEMGVVDIWINNAGVSGGSRELADVDDAKVEDIIATNLLGTCYTSKLVHSVMKDQDTGGAIFNLAGAGSDGVATPMYSVYGATKAGIVQFSKSMQEEWRDTNVDMHVISPGMMFTDLLMDNLSNSVSMDKMEVIEFLCTHPELVAYHLAPRIKRAYFYQEESYIRFLTAMKVVGKLLTSLDATSIARKKN